MYTISNLAWPTVAEHALQTIVVYADTAQVGRIGYSASAAVGLTAATMWLVCAPLWALAMGVLSCVSRAIGANERKLVKDIAGQAVLITLVAGLGLTAITLGIAPFLPSWLGADMAIQRNASLYFAIVCSPMFFQASNIIFAAILRATGDSNTPMRINVLMNALNILLNFILINPPWIFRVGSLAIHL